MAKTENVSDFIHGPGPEWLRKSPYAICRYKSIKYIFKSHKVGQWMGKALLHEAIFGQPVPGNLHVEKAFTFEHSPISLVDRRTMFEK